MSKFRSVLFAVIGLCVGLIFLFLIHRPSWMMFDFAQRQLVAQEQNTVALVVVDQKSLDRLAGEGVVFPLPRQLFGAL
ncbi:MAG: hypothetical protein ACXVAX_05860, partial [Pseudobdellovibrio sp.]